MPGHQEVVAGRDFCAADPGVHFLRQAHEMPAQSKFVMSIIKYQRSAAAFLRIQAPARADAGTCHSVGLTPELLLMRIVSRSPISPLSIKALARCTGG